MRKYVFKRANSFVYAFKGIFSLIGTQPNAVIHLFATVIVVSFGFYFKLKNWEWCAIIICIALVWIAEALNTAIEFVVNLVSPEYHPLAGKAKDVAAASVLLAAFFAVIVGLIIFGPRFLAVSGISFPI
ncbi:MAG: diacylglycerol kinase family protein [Sphingobacteriales bacterium]|nr:MAG: diacylglycerol kinase family protein [Sphingobacteriales bacterium]